MSSSGPFYSTGGIVLIAFLLFVQLLVASSVNARPSGDQALLGGDQPDCESFIKNNFENKCGEEAAIRFPGKDDPSRCRLMFESHKCQTLAACKSCTSDSLAVWIQIMKGDTDMIANLGECKSVANEKPTIECQATPPPPTTEPTTSTFTSTSTTVAPTTASGFPVWIIVVVIVAIVVLIGAITFTYFLCRKSNTPKPPKASKRMASSGTVAVATSANVRPSPSAKGKRNRSSGRGGKSRRTSQG